MKKLIAAVFAATLALAFGAPAQAATSADVYIGTGHDDLQLTNVAYYRHWRPRHHRHYRR